MTPPSAAPASVASFISRWQDSTASELSTAQSFVIELCDLLGVPRPHPTPAQDYMFERPITFAHGDGSQSPGRVDCYRRGAFVLESKKLKPGAQGLARSLNLGHPALAGAGPLPNQTDGASTPARGIAASKAASRVASGSLRRKASSR